MRQVAQGGRRGGQAAPVGAGSDADARLSIHVEPRPSAISGARRALLNLREHLDANTLDDVRLLVSELVTNSVRHSSAAAEEPVSVDVSVTSSRVRIEVTDRGAGFDPGQRSDRHGQASGWGLMLVERLADRWGVRRREGTCVWLEIDQPRSPHARTPAG